MNLNNKHLQRFVELTKQACYNYWLKQEYRNLGRRILKFIVEQLGLAKGEFDIRWNPGGVACSGDHILHTDKFYLALHDNIGLGWFFFRSCNGRRDYSGGQNINVTWNFLLQPEGLCNLIQSLKIIQAGGYKENNGDFNMNTAMIQSRCRSLTAGY